VSATASPPHDADAPVPTPVGEPCPVCGAPLHPEQSWCLRCGSAARTRLAPSPNWKPPLAALAVVVALALGALAAALVDLAGGSGTVPAITTTVTTAAAATTPTTPPATTTAAGASSTPTTAAPTSTTTPKTGAAKTGTVTSATKTKRTGATSTPGATGTSSTPTHTSTAGAKLSPTVKSEISKGAKERLEQLDSKKALPGASEK
jgi:hypothetical protein